METLLAQVIIGLAGLLFAVMAIGPLLIEGMSASPARREEEEDRVLSIVPVAPHRLNERRFGRPEPGRPAVDPSGSERRTAA